MLGVGKNVGKNLEFLIMKSSITLKNYLSVGDGVYSIAPNLFYRVKGKYRNFYFRYTVNHKRKEVTVGSAKKISLTQAKELGKQLSAAFNAGQDPKQVLARKEPEKEAETEEPQSPEPTVPAIPLFKDYALQCIQTINEVKAWRGRKTLSNWKSSLRIHVYPVIGDKTLDAITRQDIIEILTPIWHEKNDTASKIRSRIENILSYAVMDGYLDSNPASWKGNIERFFPSSSRLQKNNHYEAMPLSELQDKIGCFYPATNRTRQVILFTILTASRVGESVPAKWSEIDWENKIWSVPPERRKDSKPYPHRVPLSRQAVELLKSIEHKGEAIFCFSEDNLGSRYSLRPLLQKMTGTKATMHGFRSTFRDWCAENGISDILAEKSLMHATGNAVVQAYQRSDLLEQRREVMQAWADTVFAKWESKEKN